MRRFSFLLLVLLFSSSACADAPRTFREAKKMAWTIYADRPVDFYGCQFRATASISPAAATFPANSPSGPSGSNGSTSCRPG